MAKILNLYRNEISAISMLLHAYTVCMMCATLLGPKESLLNVYTGSMLVHVVGDGVLAAFFMQVCMPFSCMRSHVVVCIIKQSC